MKAGYSALLLVFILSSCSTMTASGSGTNGEPGLFEIRLEELSSIDNDAPFNLKGTSEKVILAEVVLFDSGDIAGAEMLKNDNGSVTVIFQLNSDAAEKFAAMTESNRGRKLGVVVKGECVSLSVIGKKIEDGRIAVTGVFSEEEASSAVKMLSGKNAEGSAK